MVGMFSGSPMATIWKPLSAIRAAKFEEQRPSLVIVRTHIGYGSPKQDTKAAHGEPLGQEALQATKKTLGWPVEPSFYIPEVVRARFRRALDLGAEIEAKWQALLEGYSKEYPELATQFRQAVYGEVPSGYDTDLPVFQGEQGSIATRDASSRIMNALVKRLPTFAGGSADLAPSTKTTLIGYGDFGFKQACGHNIHFGTREHAMGAVINSMALHGGIIPYGATFLVFSDYMRPALRLAALMQVHAIFIFTHDSIALGEDGPTHQPVEHLMSLRAIPGLVVLRPADANETTAAWRVAIGRRGPIALVLTRQRVPVLDLNHDLIAEGVPRGAYILVEAEKKSPDIILIATGSEVHSVLKARAELKTRGVQARVVSMPSWELFDEQPLEYRQHVLLPDVPKLAVEAGITRGWCSYVGDTGDVIGLNRFGASAPGEVVLEKLGFNVEHILNRASALLGKEL